MESKTFAYIRVSSKDQNVDRQIDSLKQYILDERDFFIDKQSGKDVNREALQSLLHICRSGDTVYVHSLDRLGRNARDIKELVALFRDKGVFLKILDIPTTLMDYSVFDSKLQKMIMEMVNNILIEVLATIAETERDLIRKRQEEGIASAHARGVKFGRKPIPFPESWESDYKRWRANKCSAASLYHSYGWNFVTFYRKVKIYEDSISVKKRK